MNAEIISWLIILEITLPFVILSLILIAALLKNRKRNTQAARQLILNIKKNEAQQKEKAFEFLTQKLAIDEAKAKKLSQKIINERKFLFRNLISGFLDKNTAAIMLLDDDLSRISEQYHNLEVALEQQQPEEIVVEEDPEEESVDDLKREIKSLKHEVHVTLTTLNNIFSEFSSMFGEEVPDQEMSVDQIITAMETFSNKSEAGSDDSLEGEHDIDDEIDVSAMEESEPDAFAEALEEELEEGVEEEQVTLENEPTEEAAVEVEIEEDELDFSIDSELDDIDSALDELELGGASGDDEPSWDEAFEESGDKMEN